MKYNRFHILFCNSSCFINCTVYLLLTLYPIRGPRKWSTIFFSNISPGKCGRCGHVRCQDNYHVRCQDNYHVAKCVWLNAAAGSFSRNGQRSQRDSQSEICTSTLEKNFENNFLCLLPPPESMSLI